MNLYDCKVGDVVVTGDASGMSPCVCVREKYFNEDNNYYAVDFLRLTDGIVYDAGCADGWEHFLDKCHFVDIVNEKELERLKKVWNV